jgi:ribonuclease PH
MFNIHSVEIDWGGRPLRLETGKIARQADGAVLATYGETVVLATVVAAKTAREGVDFLPLTVDYIEKTYAAGRIPGGYFKREGRPTEKETLVSRLIDRPIRPLFVDGWRNETQVIATVISADPDNNPDVVAITGASCALYLSDIPFSTPIAGVRIGLIVFQFLDLAAEQDRMLAVHPGEVVQSLDNLVIEKEGRMCVRFYQRADGSALTSDCPVGVRIKAVHVSRRIGFAFSGFLGFAAHAWAQPPAMPTRSLLEAIRMPILSGAVVDPLGSRIVNAAVELHDSVTGRKFSVKTDATGQFRFSSLGLGSYSIKIESPGFSVGRSNLTLLAGQAHWIEVTLQLGLMIGETVVVEAVPKR